MSNKISDSLRTEKRRHQNELKNLIVSNNNEIAKIKNEHEKNKSQVRIQNKVEINGLLNEGEKKLLQTTEKNEQTLKNLQESIELSKQRAAMEKERINSQLESKKQDQKMAYDNYIARTKENYAYRINDLEHEAQTELERINNRIKNKKSELKETSRNEFATLKQSTLNKKQMTKDLYEKKRNLEQNKYDRALTSMKKHHQDILTKEERLNQNKLKVKQEAIKEEITRVDKDGKNRLEQLHTNHQKKYQANYEKTETETSRLMKRKESIINNFKQKLRKEGNLQVAKNQDPFYHYKEIPAKITKLPEKQGYLIEVKVPQHEVENVRMSAHKREVSLFMDRKIKEVKNYKDGSQTRLNKVETLSSKVNVEDFLNPRDVQQTYKDGVLSYKIGLA